MRNDLVKFMVEDSNFSQKINWLARETGRDQYQVFKDEGRLLAGELIQRTPPMSGRAIVKMTAAAGKVLRDVAVEDLSARKVGERAVQRDILQIIMPMRGSNPQAPAVYKGQARAKVYSLSAVEDWGVHQKCMGRDAVRIFTTKGGKVYGVDVEDFKPNASLTELAEVHKRNRGARGRVSRAAQGGETVIGRWRWLDAMITKQETVRRYIAQKQKMVGQAKGGWAKGFLRLGGRMSPRGWIGRHQNAGEFFDHSRTNHPNFLFVNRSAWARGGDIDRVIPAALAGRARALAGAIKHAIRDKAKRIGVTR